MNGPGTVGCRPASTWLLATAQALNLTCAVIMVTVAALAGSELASSAALATLPYGAQFASIMACTYPASMLMRHCGRRPVFVGAACVLLAAGIVGFIAMEQRSFLLLVLTHVLVGSYIACANFYRFAAIDELPVAARSGAMSLVVAGGVAAAVIGPAVVTALHGRPGFAALSLVYASLFGLGLASLAVLAAWRPSTAILALQEAQAGATQNTMAKGWHPGNGHIVGLAIFSAAGGYLVMNLLMVQASLVMKTLCSFTQASGAIQAHVLAMFAPSFFTGRLIGRLGLCKVLATGFLLLLAASACGLLPPSYEHAVLCLVLLGLGWNLTYVGGGALLAQGVAQAQRHRWQGIMDTLVAACATAGAFLPAPLLAVAGWQGTNLLVLPLAAAGIAMTWYTLAHRAQHATSLGPRSAG